jgi:hypothetical protein
MECSCEIDIDADEPAQCYRSKMVKSSRKEFKCAECREIIPVGSTYESASYIEDGKYHSIKTCDVCREIRKTFFPNGCYFNMMYELLYDHIREVDVIPEDCLSQMSPKARSIVCNMIQDYNDEDDE